jgi:hypothetical protein
MSEILIVSTSPDAFIIGDLIMTLIKMKNPQKTGGES